MPAKVLVIVPFDFDLGFKLAGIDTLGCLSVEEAKGYLEKELLQPRYGLILIDENFLLTFDTHLKKKIQESVLPFIMAIPLKRSLKEEVEAKDYFLKVVRDAIGYEIRVK